MLPCTSFHSSAVPLCQVFGKNFLVEYLHKFSLGVVNRHRSIKSEELLQTTKLTQCTLINTCCVHKSNYVSFNLIYICTLPTQNKHHLSYVLPHSLRKEGKPELLSVIPLDSSSICEPLYIWFGFCLGWFFFLLAGVFCCFVGVFGGREGGVFGSPKL